MVSDDSQTELLLDRAAQGEDSAIEHLLTLHRSRLRRMVAVRIDPRLAARVDPSDVVQEAALEAVRKLPAYLKSRACPFYPWIRQIAWEKLIQLHRRHVEAQCRSVRREVSWDMNLPDESIHQLADVLVARQSSPSRRVVRREVRQRVGRSLEQLAATDREVLVLRHLEQLSLGEVSDVLGISLAATQSRYRRALERLHSRLGDDLQEGLS